MSCTHERRNDVYLQRKTEVTNLASGIRQYDVVFLMYLLHMTFKETDAQMQKC